MANLAKYSDEYLTVTVTRSVKEVTLFTKRSVKQVTLFIKRSITRVTQGEFPKWAAAVRHSAAAAAHRLHIADS